MSAPFQIRSADRIGDNAALCELARQCPQGRRLRFYHERNDYWERGRFQPHLDVFVTEEAGELTAAVSVGRKEWWIHGVRNPTAYVHDLMVRPDRRGRGLGRALITTVRQACGEARLFYCCIVDDNAISRRLFEAEGFAAHPRRLLYHAVLPALARRRPSCRLRLGPGTADGQFELQQGASLARTTLRRQDAQVFVDLPWPVGLLGRLTTLLPAVGRPVRAWTLHHLGCEGGTGPRLLRRLVCGIAWHAAQTGADAVVIPLFENDPLTPEIARMTLTRWGLPPGAARLYVAGKAADAVLGMPHPPPLDPRDA